LRASAACARLSRCGNSRPRCSGGTPRCLMHGLISSRRCRRLCRNHRRVRRAYSPVRSSWHLRRLATAASRRQVSPPLAARAPCLQRIQALSHSACTAVEIGGHSAAAAHAVAGIGVCADRSSTANGSWVFRGSKVPHPGARLNAAPFPQRVIRKLTIPGRSVVLPQEAPAAACPCEGAAHRRGRMWVRSERSGRTLMARS
jgi:hypothetical protein